MGLRILVIEDNPANLDLMSYLLKAFGHEVQTAGNGAEGLVRAGQDPPDLIMCDIQLPVLDGFGVARALKQDPVLKRIPLLAITAFAMVGDRERVLAEGFDGCLLKPINPRTFVSEVEAMLAAGRDAARRP
jgi:two-component system cell cycle response regulator